MPDDAIRQTDLVGLKPFSRGKVRDIYEVGDCLLIVATDRLSAFDVVLPTPIPRKGDVLTALTLFWLALFRSEVANHLVTADVMQMPAPARRHADALRGRSMLVRRAVPLRVECVVRGYLAGSGWKSYRQEGAVCGVRLPRGLKESSRLPQPVFTPSTKAETGHDDPLDFAGVVRLVGEEHARLLRDKSLWLYSRAAEYAASRGVLIADTKFEWGLVDGRLTLIDEVLTPDSSRFWPSDGYAPGGPQPSYDKQYVRDWLDASGWNREPPAPTLPPDVVARTTEKYVQAYERITGRALQV
jgi:phosphoribosylaminoimidazole-succinocarboxamide synthase